MLRGRAVRDDRAGRDERRSAPGGSFRANGIDGTATIDKLADTGETIGDERLFTMEVTLHMPGTARPRTCQPSAAMVPITAADQGRGRA